MTADLSSLLVCPDLPITVVSLVTITILTSRASSVELFVIEYHPRPSICASLLPLLPLWPPPPWLKAVVHQPILPKSMRHALVLVSNAPCTHSKPPSPFARWSGERELDHSHCLQASPIPAQLHTVVQPKHQALVLSPSASPHNSKERLPMLLDHLRACWGVPLSSHTTCCKLYHRIWDSSATDRRWSSTSEHRDLHASKVTWQITLPKAVCLQH